MFLAGSLTAVLLMSYYAFLSVQIYEVMHSTKGIYHSLTDLPEFNQVFWIPICSAFALHCFKRQVINVSVPWFCLITKDQEDRAAVRQRAERAGFSLYKFIWYTSSSIIGYVVLKDSPVLPKFLGGKADSFDEMWASQPYQPQLPYMLECSLIGFGYFIEDFMYHNFCKERTSDFWEMNFHHLLTLTLFGGMIFQNFIRAGLITAWLHNVTDILTSLSRVLSQTHYKKATYISFGSCLVLWIYCRNLAFPFLTYKTIVLLNYPPELARFQAGPDILKLCLVCLCFLHIYWTTLFTKMIVSGVKSGDTDDKQRRRTKTEEKAKAQ